MKSCELDSRIKAYKRGMLKKALPVFLFPLLVLLYSFFYTLYLQAPNSVLIFWPLPIMFIGCPIIMSVLLTRFDRVVSNRVGLICPHCKSPLGGHIKLLKNEMCPLCSQSIIETE